MFVTWATVWACLLGAGPGDGTFHAFRDQGPGDGAFHAVRDQGPGDGAFHALRDQGPGDGAFHAFRDQGPGDGAFHALKDQVPGNGAFHAFRDQGPRDGAFHALGDQVSPKVDHGHDLTSLSDVSDINLKKERNAMALILQKRWPNNTVPIAFTKAFMVQYKPMVYEAMDLFNTLTCVRFRNATFNTNTKKMEYRIKIIGTDAICSAINGYVEDSLGYQNMWLHPGCFSVLGVLVHEFLHALGFKHTHMRPDRNDYIRIHWHRIMESTLPRFRIQNETYDYLFTFGLPYDYASIMHLPVPSFTKDPKGLPTLELKKPYPGTLGHLAPSRTDIALINRLHECWDHYLGDDIPEAVLYEDFHSRYFKTGPEKPVSYSLERWIRYMWSHKTQ